MTEQQFVKACYLMCGFCFGAGFVGIAVGVLVLLGVR